MNKEQYSHRKSAARLQILNADGTPAARTSVSVDQISHRFLFGCGAFDAVDLMKTQDAAERAFLQERMEKWLALFNYGTLPFYWGRYEPVEGQTAYSETFAAAKWLREKGATVKGHPLCWHTSCAPWLLQFSNEEIMRRPDLPEDSLALLQYLNRALFETVENTVSIDLLSRLFSSQLVTHGEKHLLDRSRTYYKLLRRIVTDGQARGEIRTDFTVSEVCRAYAMFERGLMYDWCLSGGEYSLPNYAARMMPMFLSGFRS